MRVFWKVVWKRSLSVWASRRVSKNRCKTPRGRRVVGFTSIGSWGGGDISVSLLSCKCRKCVKATGRKVTPGWGQTAGSRAQGSGPRRACRNYADGATLPLRTARHLVSFFVGFLSRRSPEPASGLGRATMLPRPLNPSDDLGPEQYNVLTLRSSRCLIACCSRFAWPHCSPARWRL